MLEQVANGVSVHRSDFCQSNAVVVHGRDGVLLVDPGVREAEITCLADDIQQLGLPVVAGFSTHPHWDHLLWHARLGAAPRFGTDRCAATVRQRLSGPGAMERVASVLPADIADQIPLDLLGVIAGLPADAERIPWDGPRVRVIEHSAHAPGHAALLIEDQRVLVAGDMLSDVLIPFLDLFAADPVGDYLAGLDVLEAVAGGVDVIIPGHGSVAGGDQVRARIDLDRAYVQGLQVGDTTDPRLGPAATFGQDFLPGVHERHLQRLAANL